MVNCVSELKDRCSVFWISCREILSVGGARRRFGKIATSRFECFKNEVKSRSEREMPAPNVTIGINLEAIFLICEVAGPTDLDAYINQKTPRALLRSGPPRST